MTASTDDNGTAGAQSGSDASSIGIQVGMGAVTVAANAATKSLNDNSEDYSSTTIGASYNMGNGMVLGVYQNAGDDDKEAAYDYKQTAASITYTIAPGLTAALTMTDTEMTDGGTTTTDDYTVLEISASF